VIWRISHLRQHAGEHFQAKIVLVAQAISPTLDNPDLVVDAFPVSFDHVGEFLEGRQSLPAQ